MGVRGEIYSTKVALENRTYFFNVKENRLGDLYLNVVESKNKDSGGFDRQSIILFAEDLQEFLKGFDDALKVMEKAVKQQGKPKAPARRLPERHNDEHHSDEKRPDDNRFIQRRPDAHRPDNYSTAERRFADRRSEGRSFDERPFAHARSDRDESAAPKVGRRAAFKPSDATSDDRPRRPAAIRIAKDKTGRPGARITKKTEGPSEKPARKRVVRSVKGGDIGKKSESGGDYGSKRDDDFKHED